MNFYSFFSQIEAFILSVIISLSVNIKSHKIPKDSNVWITLKEWSEIKKPGMRRISASFFSTKILDQCRQKPQFYLTFPLVYASSHEVYLDGIKKISFGDSSFKKIKDFYQKPIIPCADLQETKELKWNVISSDWARVKFRAMPSLKKRDGRIFKFINNQLHIFAAGGLLAVALLCCSLFGFSISNPSSYYAVFSCLGFSLYVALKGPISEYLDLSYIQAAKSRQLFAIFAEVNLFLGLQERGLLKNFESNSFLILCLFITPLVCFTEDMSVDFFLIECTQICVSFLVFFALFRLVLKKISSSYFKYLNILLVFFIGFLMIYEIMARNMDVVRIGTLMPFMMLSFLMIQVLWISSNNLQVYTKNTNLRHSLTKKYYKNAFAERSVQGLAHDLKKPISMTEALVEILANADNLDSFLSMRQKFSKEVHTAKNKVERMLDSFDCLSRDQDKNKVKNINLNSMIFEIVNEFKNRFPSIDFKSKITFSLVNIDPSKLERVLNNLIENAQSAMCGEGCITIFTKENSEEIFFSIKNTHSFISENSLENIFTPFYTTNEKSNSGLGLYIVRSFVTDWGGSIICKSGKEPEDWVEFYFSIPKNLSSTNKKVFT